MTIMHQTNLGGRIDQDLSRHSSPFESFELLTIQRQDLVLGIRLTDKQH